MLYNVDSRCGHETSEDLECLSADQKENRLFAPTDLVRCADFMTGDETWIYGYDPKQKPGHLFGNSYCLNNDFH